MTNQIDKDQLKPIQEINIRKACIGYEELRVILWLVENLKGIQSVSLHGCKLESSKQQLDIWKILGRILSCTNPTIKNIDYSDLKLTAGSVQSIIIDPLKDSKRNNAFQHRRIDLSQNDLGDDGICALLKFCGEHKSILQHLIIGYNNATFKSLNELALFFRNGGALKELNINGFLFDKLQKFNKPQAISAPSNNETVQPLEQNRSSHEQSYIQYNNIYSYNITDFLQELSTINASVQILSLEHLDINDKSLSQIINLITNNTHISWLNLSHNKLIDAVLLKIISSSCNHPSLQKLELIGNCFSGYFCQLAKEITQYNRSQLEVFQNNQRKLSTKYSSSLSVYQDNQPQIEYLQRQNDDLQNEKIELFQKAHFKQQISRSLSPRKQVDQSTTECKKPQIESAFLKCDKYLSTAPKEEFRNIQLSINDYEDKNIQENKNLGNNNCLMKNTDSKDSNEGMPQQQQKQEKNIEEEQQVCLGKSMVFSDQNDNLKIVSINNQGDGFTNNYVYQQIVRINNILEVDDVLQNKPQKLNQKNNFLPNNHSFILTDTLDGEQLKNSMVTEIISTKIDNDYSFEIGDNLQQSIEQNICKEEENEQFMQNPCNISKEEKGKDMELGNVQINPLVTDILSYLICRISNNNFTDKTIKCQPELNIKMEDQQLDTKAEKEEVFCPKQAKEQCQYLNSIETAHSNMDLNFVRFKEKFLDFEKNGFDNISEQAKNQQKSQLIKNEVKHQGQDKDFINDNEELSDQIKKQCINKADSLEVYSEFQEQLPDEINMVTQQYQGFEGGGQEKIEHRFTKYNKDHDKLMNYQYQQNDIILDDCLKQKRTSKVEFKEESPFNGNNKVNKEVPYTLFINCNLWNQRKTILDEIGLQQQQQQQQQVAEIEHNILNEVDHNKDSTKCKGQEEGQSIKLDLAQIDSYEQSLFSSLSECNLGK